MQKNSLTAMVMATMTEAKPFIKNFALTQEEKAPFPVFSHNNILLIISGIGKSNAAMAAFYLCRTRRPERIVNIGAAGAAGPHHLLGEIYHIHRIIEYDRPDLKTGNPCSYQPHFLKGFPSAVLATQDRPVIFPEHRKAVSQSADLVDMEGAAVAHACSRFDLPCLFFKYVTDTPEQCDEDRIVPAIRRYRDKAFDFFTASVMPLL